MVRGRFGLPLAFLALVSGGPVAADDVTLPEDGGPRWWAVQDGALDVAKAPDSSDIVSVLDEGAIVRLVACETIGARTWCEIRPLRGGWRGVAPADRLDPAEGPDGVVAMGPDTSKRRARARKFDAKGEIACAQEAGQSLGTCKASIARSGGGDATLVVTFPNGFARSLFFSHGEFVSASATMSGVGTDTDWRLQDGLHIIRVDDQAYQIPDAFLLGE